MTITLSPNMDVEENKSIARGVFVFKKGVATAQANGAGPKEQIKRRRSKAKKNKDKLNRSFSAGRTPKTCLGDPYKDTWTHALNSFKEQQEETFDEVLSAVAHFCKERRSDEGQDGQRVTINGRPSIPAAALLTGVNLPDHEFLFGLLASRLRSTVTPHVARLRACGASGASAGTVSLRAMTRSTVAQLLLKVSPLILIL